MIYFDNSATTLEKPPVVAKAVADAIVGFGNAGRSFQSPAMEAARAVWGAREQVAALTRLSDPLHVAFTSGATESLNLVLQSLVSPEDGVITTVLEHNSVLRPLYRIGCPIKVLDCGEEGELLYDSLPQLLDRYTHCVVCTHGSNLLGNVTDTRKIQTFCKEHGLIFILDAAQTLGSIEVTADMADVICFTGHKSLFGPQGTGGIIAQSGLPFRLVKTGGSGTDSFAPHQPLVMPDIFEAGTQNAHGLAGLAAGVAFVNGLGVEAIHEKEQALTARFLQGIAGVPGVKLCGPKTAENRLPIVALNVGDAAAERVALRLWEEEQIAVRAGSHCAPLAHRRFGTEERGMVRFSFSWFNTEAEIDAAIEALGRMA